MINVYSPTSKVDMMKAFPENIATIVGKPTLKEIVRVLRHSIDFSQSHEVQDKNSLNLLHIYLPVELYVFFVTNPANKQHPARTMDPGQALVHNLAGNSRIWSHEKLEWEHNKMALVEEKNMD